MPACKLCRKRIDVSRTGVRAYRCSRCGLTVCRSHYLDDGGICVRCAGRPVVMERLSFIRPPLSPGDDGRQG